MASDKPSIQRIIRRLMNSKLDAEHTFLRTLIDTIPSLIWLKDADGVYLACNREFELFFGASEAEIVGKTDYDFVDKDLANLFRKNDLAAQTADQPHVNEEWITYASDGHRALLETTKTPMRGTDGRLIGILGISHDITQARLTQASLRESEEKLRGLYELSPLGIALTDLSGKYIEFNEAFRRICGYSSEALKRLDYWALTPDRYKNQEAQQLDLLLRTGRYGPYEKEYRRADGTLVPLCLNGVLVTGSDGQRYIWSIAEDITERKRIEESLITREMLFRSLAENSPDLIFRYDRDGRRTYVNPSVERIVDKPANMLLGSTPDDAAIVSLQAGKQVMQLIREVVESGQPIEGEMQVVSPNGQVHHFNNRYVAELDAHGKVASVLSLARDISQIKDYERELQKIAHYDTLTGIPNRALLADRMGQAIAQTHRSDTLMAVCYIDLDGFKLVNDTYGHEAGDRLLVEMARRMQHCIRGGDTVARIGGDEFVLLFLGITQPEECEEALKRLLDSIAQPFAIDAQATVTVSASLGCTLYPLDNADADTLLRHADQAMYRVKDRNKNDYALYEHSGN